MNLIPENILLATVIIFLNILDSVSTKIAFLQYPDKELKGEGNPFMRKLMLKSGLLAEIIKQIGVAGITLLILLAGEIEVLKFMAILFGLVVLNNSFVVTSRAIMKGKVITPFRKLCRVLHIPLKYEDTYGYPVVMMMFVGISYGIYYLIV